MISFRPLLFFLPFSISFCFRWFRFAFVGFVLFRFHFVDFVSFRFVFVDFVSFLFRFALYRCPFAITVSVHHYKHVCFVLYCIYVASLDFGLYFVLFSFCSVVLFGGREWHKSGKLPWPWTKQEIIFSYFFTRIYASVCEFKKWKWNFQAHILVLRLY